MKKEGGESKKTTQNKQNIKKNKVRDGMNEGGARRRKKGSGILASNSEGLSNMAKGQGLRWKGTGKESGRGDGKI